MNDVQLRIGELSRRVGVSPERLRAWERRYGLLQPSRTSGGFRLYSAADVARVQRMQQLLAEGLAASEAARIAVGEPFPATPEPDGQDPLLERQRAELSRALETFDATAALWVLDRALAGFRLETVLSELLLPYLHDLGERWASGELTVGQEHFASNLIRGRLLALAQGWDRGSGPGALLACPPGEQHDLPLIMFGLALRGHGWRVTFLGADTPIATLGAAAEAVAPALLVLSATEAGRFEAVAVDLTGLAGRWPLALAGRGASAELASRLSARLLEGDPVGAAGVVAAGG